MFKKILKRIYVDNLPKTRSFTLPQVFRLYTLLAFVRLTKHSNVVRKVESVDKARRNHSALGIPDYFTHLVMFEVAVMFSDSYQKLLRVFERLNVV